MHYAQHTLLLLFINYGTCQLLEGSLRDKRKDFQIEEKNN